MAKILITGGAGFIGSHITKKLLKRGDNVVCVDNFNDYYSPKIKEVNVEPFLENPSYKLYRTDIIDYEAMKTIFESEKIERVCHCAARAGVRPSIENPFIYEETNTRGTLNLLHLSKEFKIENFVLFSTSSVYGETKKIPFSEEDETNPIAPYAATKRAAEILGSVYHHVHGLNVNVIRPFNIYGPNGRPDMIPFKYTRLIDEGGEITQFGDGTMKRDHTYIDDFVEGTVSAIDKIFGFEIFNLGNSNPVELRYFIQIVEKELGKKAKRNKVAIPATELPITYADISKAQGMLGYNPKIRIEEGMKIFVDWYQKNKHLYR
jgi:UDP-glucuronate 4-epimerase